MVAQGLLDFQYEAEPSIRGLTSLAGLPLYFDLIKASGLGAAIRRHVRAAGGQGWLDIQMVLAAIFLNLAGGDCVEDIERLERDRGFSAILRAIEKDLLSRAERRALKSRWRRERERATPSPSALSGWLERFHDPNSPKAVAGKAFIPAVTEALGGLWRVNQALLEFLHEHQPAKSATLDMDATLIETHKRDALHCYKKFKAYQPLNCWWAEQGAMLYSEFRDGNAPAGHEQLRVLKESLRHLPESVKKVALRSDTAGYQAELLLYCGEGKDPRFGVIEFAIGADVTEAFRAAVRATPEREWKPLIRRVDGKSYVTDQEWAEVVYVPNWAGHSRQRADHRFLAIREPLRQLELGAFTVVRDRCTLDRISREAKAHMLATMPAIHADRFRGRLSDPAFDILYRAKALVVISARAEGLWIVEDCALAAENLMLAAFAEGLGTCWIGFAQSYLYTAKGKAAIGAPAAWVQVAPIVVGKPSATPAHVPRTPPEIRWVG